MNATGDRSTTMPAPGPPQRAATGEGIRLRRMVTAIDFHESSREAALWAMRHLAPDAEHELVHVLDVSELPAPLRDFGAKREQLRQAARAGAQRRLDELASHGAGARVRSHIREGRPALEIVGLADEVGADLVLVGEQGPTRGIGALLGSTAERVLLRSRIPVMLARNVGDAPPRRILVAIDDGEVSLHVLSWTKRLLQRFDATATVLNVVDRTLLFDELSELPTGDEFRRLEQEATAATDRWLNETVGAAELPELRASAKVLLGDPSYEIIAESAREGADLVLIGSKGGDVARTPLVGRVINRVVRSAPCSVLVVKGPEGDRPAERA